MLRKFEDNIVVAIVAVWGLAVVTGVAAIAALIYVAVHFVHKIW